MLKRTYAQLLYTESQQVEGSEEERIQHLSSNSSSISRPRGVSRPLPHWSGSLSFDLQPQREESSFYSAPTIMKTLNLSGANVTAGPPSTAAPTTITQKNPTQLQRSNSTSLRASSAGVETLARSKKLKSEEVDRDQRVALATSPTASVEDLNEDQPNSGMVADEEECTPGATKSCEGVQPKEEEVTADSTKMNNEPTNSKKKEKEAKTTLPEITTPDDDKKHKQDTTAKPLVKAKTRDEERECYRHAIVDVPALVELLTLVGRCPVCRSPLRTSQIATSENNNDSDRTSSDADDNMMVEVPVVNVSLKCSRLRCQFTKNWCSSPTAAISLSSATSESNQASPK